jgi:hypothetical protein
MPFTQRKTTTCSKNSLLNPKECCACAVAAQDQHLTIPIQGSLTQTDLFQALVGMTAMNQSVHSITGLLEHVPGEMSFRYHLKELDMDELERKSTVILAHSLQQVLKLGNAYLFTIDYTNDPVRQEVVSGIAGKSATLSVWGVPTVARASG